MKSSLIWLSKIDEFAWQGSKVTPDNLKNSIIEKRLFEFFLFYTKSFLTDLLNFEKVWFWDGHGFMRHAQFSSFLGPLSTTGGTKRVISWTRSVFT